MGKEAGICFCFALILFVLFFSEKKNLLVVDYVVQGGIVVWMVLRAGKRKHCWAMDPSIVLTEESSRSAVEINGSPHLISNLIACL